jgi:hypothetical protein
MTTTTEAEIAAYEAGQARRARFRSLTGSDFESAEDPRTLIAKVLPDVTVTYGGHEHSGAEALVWHGPDGWEALVIDPSHCDPMPMGWVDSTWVARSFYFIQAFHFGLDAHAQSPLALAQAVAAMDLSVRDMVTALSVVAAAAPVEQKQAIHDLRVQAMGNYVTPVEVRLHDDGYMEVHGG